VKVESKFNEDADTTPLRTHQSDVTPEKKAFSDFEKAQD